MNYNYNNDKVLLAAKDFSNSDVCTNSTNINLFLSIFNEYNDFSFIAEKLSSLHNDTHNVLPLFLSIMFSRNDIIHLNLFKEEKVGYFKPNYLTFHDFEFFLEFLNRLKKTYSFSFSIYDKNMKHKKVECFQDEIEQLTYVEYIRTMILLIRQFFISEESSSSFVFNFKGTLLFINFHNATKINLIKDLYKNEIVKELYNSFFELMSVNNLTIDFIRVNRNVSF